MERKRWWKVRVGEGGISDFRSSWGKGRGSGSWHSLAKPNQMWQLGCVLAALLISDDSRVIFVFYNHQKIKFDLMNGIGVQSEFGLLLSLVDHSFLAFCWLGSFTRAIC